MAGKSTLACDGNMIAHLGGTGYTDLRNEHAMFADFHVVPDLDQVVDLGPLAYYRFTQGRAIDRRPGADLNVVLDPDDSDLRNLVMLAIVHGEAVSVRADDDTGVNDAPATDAGAIVDDYAGIDDRIVAEGRSGFDRDILENRDVVPDDNILSDRCEWTDGHICPQPDTWC